MGADYDELAWFYDRYWRTRYHEAARPALAYLVYDVVPSGSRVVDLCCGTGHLTRELAGRGYETVGIDRSLQMLRIARASLPSALLICADARQFALSGFDAVVATFDSINHLLTPADLVSAFTCVASALVDDGLLVFDVNMADAYASEWGKSSVVVDSDAALFVRGSYDPVARLGRTAITAFRQDRFWSRTDVDIVQRCYDDGELRQALGAAGFRRLESFAAQEVGMTGDIAVGRRFYRCAR